MFRARQRLDKYRIVRRVASGGFATVYEAEDTVEGIRVALKVPHPHLVTQETLADFRREVRVTARLDHPGIVPVKTAGFVEGHFVIVQPLGQGTLGDRLGRRLALRTALDWSQQLLEALAHAHQAGVIHCDVKPDNLLVFPGPRLRLTDFGIAKLARATLEAGGTGTVGYVAPEQAMGKPSPRSDVFSAALVIWRLLARQLPEWPFKAPLPGADRLRRLHPDLAALLTRCLSVDESRRPRDARALLTAFQRLRPRLLAGATTRRRRRRAARAGDEPPTGKDWQTLRQAQFKRQHGGALALRHACARCQGPVSEAMSCCPWCGADRPRHDGGTRRPASCPRCQRGVKLDWPSCAWCHGPSIGPLSERRYSDKDYAARCGHCRGDLLPFSRYCPWCRRKVTRAWTWEGAPDRCPRCRWGVDAEHWEHCPWCSRGLPRTAGKARRPRRPRRER